MLATIFVGNLEKQLSDSHIFGKFGKNVIKSSQKIVSREIIWNNPYYSAVLFL